MYHLNNREGWGMWGSCATAHPPSSPSYREATIIIIYWPVQENKLPKS